MLKTKTMTKKVAPKKMLKKKAVSKKITTLYGLVYKSELSDKTEDMMILNQRSHPNHCVNSYLKDGKSEDSLINMLMVKLEVMGAPAVKTTREITIKTK